MINSIDYYNPVRIFSGAGCFAHFRDYARFGTRFFIVCGRTSAQRSGALDDAIAGLQDAGLPFAVFDEVEPNPLVATCHRGGQAAHAFRADCILGIGGGSPLDAAKAVAVFAANPAMQPADIFLAARLPALPILAVNLTAGTGSEVTPYAVLTVPEIENKRSVAGDDLYPRAAFCDPAYLATLPDSFLFSTAVDALCHAAEGYFMQKANPVSDAYAEKAMALLASGIRSLHDSPANASLRAQLMYGSTLAGLVISRTGTGFVHSTGYMLTYHHAVPHGKANAYFLADFVSFMQDAAPERAEIVYRLCGADLHALVSGSPHMPLDTVLTTAQCAQYADTAIQAKNVQNAVRIIDRDTLFSILCRRLCR